MKAVTLAAALLLAVNGPVAAVEPLYGRASWHYAPTGTAAAGKPLRAFLGAGWRNDRVKVCGRVGCRVVVLRDWMGHPRRAVDLSTRDFKAVCGGLWRGVCDVRIRRV